LVGRAAEDDTGVATRGSPKAADSRPLRNTHVAPVVNQLRQMMTFRRIFGVDWSGRGRDDESNRNLAVAAWSEADMVARVENSWCRQRRTRLDLENWLAEILRPGSPAALIGLDFGFGYPRGAAKVVFNADSWQSLYEQMAKLMEHHGKARPNFSLSLT
jgi:hypothetical protein